MICEAALTTLDIPSWYFESDLFSTSSVGERRRDLLLLHVRRPEEQLKFDLKCDGPHLGPDHLALWKALRVQSELRGKEEFEISEAQIMRMLGRDEYAEEHQAQVRNLLDDLEHTHLSGDGKWITKGGQRRNFSLASRLGSFQFRDGICHAWVGSGNTGFPNGLSTESVCVPAVDVEIASQPPPARPQPQWLPEQTEHASPPKPRQPKGPGIVYILTNPAMPGLIKIGKTRLNASDRAAQLHTTGVPNAFQVEYACHTPDPDAVERVMHEAFSPKRVNDRREFFEIAPAQAIAVLSLHHQDMSQLAQSSL